MTDPSLPVPVDVTNTEWSVGKGPADCASMSANSDPGGHHKDQ